MEVALLARDGILSFGFAQDRLCFAPQNDILDVITIIRG